MRSAHGVERAPIRAASLRGLLALSSIGAGAIHAAVSPEHLEEARILGAFFIIAAAFQVAWAILVVLNPGARILGIGTLANGALIGIWLVSRTIGVPIGPDTWTPERVGALDVGATLLEVVLVAGSAAILRRWMRRPGDAAAT
ncbi:MAG TPA: hypothetical protein VE669_07155 [Actinomycetota bacterium]|nr:hypothetical protein [Actinomycetota bacterium]